MAAFGPVGEGGWATGCAPQYLGRTGAETEPDFAVFQASQALWVLSNFDRTTHALQYVTVHPNVAVTAIDIACAEPA